MTTVEKVIKEVMEDVDSIRDEEDIIGSLVRADRAKYLVALALIAENNIL